MIQVLSYILFLDNSIILLESLFFYIFCFTSIITLHGTTVTISDSTITTTGDNAGGIMTSGGGTYLGYRQYKKKK